MGNTGVMDAMSEKILYVKSMQKARVRLMSVLLSLSVVELSLVIIYFQVMPIYLILFNTVCVMANGFLVMGLLEAYNCAKKNLNKYKNI